MGSYIINFAVYTMAMIGLIFFALMVYKKCSGFGVITSSKTKHISVEETLALSPRKILYLIRVENERFLIAGDIDKTSLIAKIEGDANIAGIIDNNSQSQTAMPISVPNSASEQNTKKISETAGIDTSNITTEQIAKIRKNSGKLPKQTDSSVDDLPVIVDFPKNKTNSKDVLHNMLKKMNE